jgi:hypothetical protein
MKSSTSWEVENWMYGFVIMRNVKLMIIIKFIYWSAWQQLTDKLQTNTGGRKLVNTEEVNKQKERWRKIHEYAITKNYI